MHERRPAAPSAALPRGLLAAMAGVLVLELAATGCAPPIRAVKVSSETAYRARTENVLSSGEPSLATRDVLRKWALDRTFESDPESAIQWLHAGVADGGLGASELFALAEISYLRGSQTHGRDRFLAAAVYAWAYLFPDDPADAPSPFDPRFRLACDLYDRSLPLALAGPTDTSVDVRGGNFALPFGSLAVTLDPAQLSLGDDRRLTSFVSMADYDPEGFRNVYRRPGIGAPLVAKAEPVAGRIDERDFLARQPRIPVTLVLRLPRAREQLAGNQLHGELRLHTFSTDEATDIAGREVPVETEPTLSLAYQLGLSKVWSLELRGFLLGNLLQQEDVSDLSFLEPYQPGRIPVVFVHGTASSAGRWAEMVNDLENDPRVGDRYQFWVFSYDTGNPIPYSALKLRDALTRAVNTIDPTGKDPALRQMVVIGHSQGGLLTKLTAVDSGNVLVDAIVSKPIDQLSLPEESRDMLHRALVVEPLPFVHRVVFISTPHRGAVAAGWPIAHWVASLVTLPADVLGATGALLAGNTDSLRLDPANPKIGSVYGMTPGSPMGTALASLPIAPGVHAHSIISVLPDYPDLETGDDGVVAYRSAHIDGVESTLVVRDSHSCQANPITIQEVRRILIENADEEPAAEVSPGHSPAR